MAGKKAKKKRKKPKYQPTKYDWPALELEYLTGDMASVAEFCRLRGISKRAYERKTVGWGLKRDGIRQAGNKIVGKALSKKYADAIGLHLNWGAGLIKMGLDALIPPQAQPGKEQHKALLPQSAGEAAKMIALGAQIQKNAIMTTGAMEEMLKDKAIDIPGTNDGAKQNLVIIDLPSNGKEAKGLPAK